MYLPKMNKTIKRWLIVAGIIVVLVLIKIAWVTIAMTGMGSVDGEKNGILKRRDYLSWHLITEPKNVIDAMPSSIGRQFQGEWALYSCSMFAEALANISVIYPEEKKRCAKEIDSLVKIVLSPELREYDKQRWKNDPLDDMSGDSHISYLSHLAWMISNYERVSNDKKYEGLYKDLCHDMNSKILNSKNLNVQTYPDENIYIPDMLVAIVALYNFSLTHNGQYGDTVDKWIGRAKAKWLDRKTGIIISLLDEDGNLPAETTVKGSYAALSCYYLGLIDHDFGIEQYQRIKRYMLKDSPVTGLKEYINRSPLFWSDVDAGPILLGLSPSGTAFMTGCATLYNDQQLRKSLLKTAEIAGTTITWNGKSHYFLADFALVGEAIMLAMRTSISHPHR